MTDEVVKPDPAAPATPAAAAPPAYVHPEAPEGYPTPGHKLAAEQAEEPVDHLAEIAALATEARKASQSGVETISDKILAHVEALRS